MSDGGQLLLLYYYYYGMEITISFPRKCFSLIILFSLIKTVMTK